eukprot:g26122.t1
MKQSKIVDKDTSLPDALNVFYIWFEQNASGTVSPATDTPVPAVTTADSRSVFFGVNPRKAMGLDGVSGQALRSCAGLMME